MRELNRAQARRLALRAQGFGAARSTLPVTLRDVQRVIDRVALFQIDSINVVERAHYLPLFSRLGPYDRQLLDRCFAESPRRLFEYWGHAASLIDVRLWPALQFRMARAHTEAWSSIVRIADEQPELVEQVLQDVASCGPVSSRQLRLNETGQRTGWGWNWSGVKTALEWHFASGKLTSARRNSQFERCYDVPQRVIPPALLDRQLDEEAAHLELSRRAASALGVMSESCLADYFRTRREPTRTAIHQLVATGEMEPVRVSGWDKPLWMWHQHAIPRRMSNRALLSPFDSLIFHRERLKALFNVHYRIEIYVPAAKRVHGYYVYLFLLDDELVARVDLKADRSADVLRVNGAFTEPGTTVESSRIAHQLAAELRSMASWLGLSGVQVSFDAQETLGGDLAAVLP